MGYELKNFEQTNHGVIVTGDLWAGQAGTDIITTRDRSQTAIFIFVFNLACGPHKNSCEGSNIARWEQAPLNKFNINLGSLFTAGFLSISNDGAN